MVHRFYGGVRLPDRKGPVRREAVRPMARPPRQVILPIGEEPGDRLLVQVGDRVRLGQMLADGGARGAAVHASVSGVVTDIEPRPQSWGRESLCVVIENDGEETAPEKPAWRVSPRRDAPDDLTPGEIAEIARMAGLSGEGGGMVPTDLKLQRGFGRTELLILNGVECENYGAADRRLMLERPREVVGGARLLLRALGASRGVIAVSGNAYDAATALRNMLPLRGGELRVKVLRTKYPQGAEEQLVQRLTGRRIPKGGDAADVGCTVLNVGTAAALYDAVYDGKPLTHRIVTVGGEAVARPGNLLVPIGTPISDVIAEAGGWQYSPDRVIIGSALTGMAQADLSAPVLKGTAVVLGLTRGEERGAGKREGECLRCGKCLEVCPMRLEPFLLRLYEKAGRREELARLHADDCIECGACAWACPARLRLVEDIRRGKALLLGQEESAQASEAGELPEDAWQEETPFEPLPEGELSPEDREEPETAAAGTEPEEETGEEKEGEV